MDKYVWYVLNRCKDGKYYAHAFRLRMTENLVSFMREYPDIETMNPCESKTYAKELAQYWNECYKKNGTYMFGNVKF